MDDELWLDEQGEPFVCASCASDWELKEFVESKALANRCSFCEKESETPFAAPADAVVTLLLEYIGDEFEDAAEHVPYETREGGYQARTKDRRDLLEDELGVGDMNEVFFEYVIDRIPDYPWVQKNFWSLHPYDALRYGWEEFSRLVKHRTRYLFFRRTASDDFDEAVPPQEMLRELGKALREARRVRTLKQGTLLYRVVTHLGPDQTCALSDVGSPPEDRVRAANRMSPAGISMLYVSGDAATAKLEMHEAVRQAKQGTIAVLRLEKPLRIVDLARLPPVRRLTGGLDQRQRARLHFVHAFARDIRKPVVRDQLEHIDYVPTQVVTEFLRFRFTSGGKNIDGIRYGSAKTERGRNTVLFLDHNDLDGAGTSKSVAISLLDYEHYRP